MDRMTMDANLDKFGAPEVLALAAMLAYYPQCKSAHQVSEFGKLTPQGRRLLEAYLDGYDTHMSAPLDAIIFEEDAARARAIRDARKKASA